MGAAIAYASPIYLEPSLEVSAPSLLDPGLDVELRVDLIDP